MIIRYFTLTSKTSIKIIFYEKEIYLEFNSCSNLKFINQAFLYSWNRCGNY